MSHLRSRWLLAATLFALALLFSLWFHDDKHWLLAMLVFTLPPLLMLVAVLRGGTKAAFWSGVLGLLWFCHGVMAAYGLSVDRAYGWAEIVLAVIIVFAASWPGLSARFGRRKATR